MRFLGTAPAPEAVAERLGIEAGSPVHVRRRTTLIDGRPNQLADSFYELELAEAVPAIKEEDTGPGGGFARIEEAGYRLARIREEIALRMPTRPGERRSAACRRELPSRSSSAPSTTRRVTRSR